MTVVHLIDNQQNTEQIEVKCQYFKKPGHVIRDCRERMKNEQEQRNNPSIQNTKPLKSRSFAPCSHCQRTNHAPQKCWNGPNTAKRPKRFKRDYPADNRNEWQEPGNLTLSGAISILISTLHYNKITILMGRVHISGTIRFM